MKERLTGAIILVALIVLLVPEFLSGPVHSSPRVAAATVASAEEPPLRSYTINLAEDAHARTAAHASGPQQPAPITSTAPEADAAGTPHAAPALPAPEPTPAPPPQAASPPAPPPVHSPGAVPQGPGDGSTAFMVQLGSFSNRTNADRLARQVRTQGYPVSVSQGSSGRRLYRVRVGPAKDRAAASQLAAQLRASGHGGSIVPE